LKTKAIVDKAGRFYKAQDRSIGTHLALRWSGRDRFIVPRAAAAQRVCWRIFHPGWQELPLRAMAHVQSLLGAECCGEDEKMAAIREALGKEAGVSCCRIGTPGIWSKDTILFLHKQTNEPMYIVKAGMGRAVDLLLQNEADWLHTLREQATLADHIPALIAHRSGADFSFVAESPLPGKPDHRLGELHFAFLRKFQEYSRRTIRYEESKLYRNLHARLKDLDGLLTEAWSIRIEKAMRRIEQSLSGSSILFVAAHNDFAPWNIRVERGVARIFDWEYADDEQLPLFDPLHFVLMPMALKRRPAAKIDQSMRETIALCRQQLGEEFCLEARAQALAYMLSLCTIYLWGVRGESNAHPVFDRYACMIDRICGR
jgi:hypothetical protein